MQLVFVGVAPGALCEQVKDPARNGGKDMAALRAHLDNPLVTVGLGRRASAARRCRRRAPSSSTRASCGPAPARPARSSSVQRYEYRKGKSQKFWEIVKHARKVHFGEQQDPDPFYKWDA